MVARSALSLALLALCISCLLGAEGASKMRVRKSMWALTKREFKMYVRGVATMLTVSTKQGQRLYGPLYKDAEYFIVKHGVNANTPVKDLNPGLGPAEAPNCYSPQDAPATRVLIVPGTCDVAHDGPWFMTFHTAFMLEFENSLLSVEPDLPGLPYWEMYEEFKGVPGRQGAYYGSPNGMLTPKNFGDIPGDPNNNYQVKEGIFRDRMIPAFTPAICKEKGYPACDVYNGSKAGLLRQFDNNLTQPHIIRYPYTALTQVPSRAYLAGGKEINFTRNDFARCSDPKIIKNMWNWVNCVDLYSIQVSGVDTQGWSLNNPLYTNGTNGFASVGSYHHALYHNMIGSFQPGTVGPTLPFGLLGDARTTSTSPNEIWLFYPFHNNLMRGFMIWQRNILAVDPKQADQDVLFGYPKNATNVPPIMRQGTGIDDIVSPRMPFTDLWPGISSKGVTHRDMLNWKPNYRYDVMQFK